MIIKKFTALFQSCFGLSISGSGAADSPSLNLLDKSSSCSSSIIRLSDGRYLAYQERGVPKNEARYKVIIVHGFGSSKNMSFLLSQEMINELGIYMLLYDRAGYGESNPNPKRSTKTEASDIQELSEQLQLGPKFYLIGISFGVYPLWSCLRRIPKSLAGVAMVAPMINYNWPSLPNELVKDDCRKGMTMWGFLAARYIPWLVHWWLTQKIFPSSNVLDRNRKFFCDKDLEVLKNTPTFKLLGRESLKQEGVFDSLRNDFMAAFGKWDFDPLELSDPFPRNEIGSSLHIWHGRLDKVVPVELQRFVSGKLPWIRYHEVPDKGHLIIYDDAVCEAIIRSLLLGEDNPFYRPKT
ncbi:probable lysophospholipase BODYGUARD 2 [Impatiens glandulifera]|uniref:probable lysophospholipase BODYGUARD 2 n=1 Tax=Impatiens glandulifera TaxID=253017 RepID=UPI001FB18A40|nr:probable lysophospholipase BODYGUARD 2 [Impatiens glandulifera]